MTAVNHLDIVLISEVQSPAEEKMEEITLAVGRFLSSLFSTTCESIRNDPLAASTPEDLTQVTDPASSPARQA
ncbi:hypothetical protein QQF64_004747 [Cirrhinus molitorella]|uniref:Uncharacterized protein n=1 Tax=Cirrhinus molitorella TaxID=172907 RepID=A0ABR3MH53_9TELE